MLEDVPNDAVLVERELTKAGLAVSLKRVETADHFLKELQRHTPDVILSDHAIPSHDPITILAMVRCRYPDTPFIFVTGAMDEADVTKAFEAGATDCVLKHRLSGLVHAIRCALREVEERSRRRAAETERDRLARELDAAQAQMKKLSGTWCICSRCKSIRDEHGVWRKPEAFLTERSEITFTHGVCPVCVRTLYAESS